MKAAWSSLETISPSVSDLFCALSTDLVLASQSCFSVCCPTYVWARVYFELQRFVIYSFSAAAPVLCYLWQKGMVLLLLGVFLNCSVRS